METHKLATLQQAFDAHQLHRPGTLLWRSQDGRETFIEHMQTTHLFNSIRMIFDHTVPQEHQIEGGRYPITERNMPLDTRKMVIQHMLQELTFRNDLQPSHLRDLAHMRDTFARLDTLKLTN